MKAQTLSLNIDFEDGLLVKLKLKLIDQKNSTFLSTILLRNRIAQGA